MKNCRLFPREDSHTYKLIVVCYAAKNANDDSKIPSEINNGNISIVHRHFLANNLARKLNKKKILIGTTNLILSRITC